VKDSLRLIYAGTPEFAVPALESLHSAGHTIVAVLTQPDRPAGRGQKLQESPVKQAASKLGLKVLQPLSLRKAAIKKELRALDADAMVVAAYGLLLPQSVLDIPRYACLNIHASLLPRWRGAAPIQRALEAGDEQTGITIMHMDAGLDTGKILSQAPLPLDIHVSAQSVHDALAQMGAQAIVAAMQNLPQQLSAAQPQDDRLATYAHKLYKQEGRIDWQQSAVINERKIRAFNPWPGSFSMLEQKRMRIWRSEVVDFDSKPSSDISPGQVIDCTAAGIDVQTGCGILRLLEVQLAGRKRLAVAEFVNAHDLQQQRFE